MQTPYTQRRPRRPAARTRWTIAGGPALAAGLFLAAHAAVIDDMNPCHPDNFAWNKVDIIHSCDDGQLTLRVINDLGLWYPGASVYQAAPHYILSAVYGAGFANLPLRENEVLELSVDYVSSNRDDVFAYLLYGDRYVTDDLLGWYGLARDRDEVVLLKSASMSGLRDTVIFWETVPSTDDPVTMVLAMTRLGDTARITARIQLQADPSQVLFERTVLDGPGVDFTNEGMVGPKQWLSVSDIGAPYMEMGSFQETGIVVMSDGGEPLPELVLDNLEYSYTPILDVQKGSMPLQTTPLDDFNDGGHWTGIKDSTGQYVYDTTDGQLRISGPHLPLPKPITDAYYSTDLEIRDGYTLELRVDRLGVNQDGLFGGVALQQSGRGYSFMATQSQVILHKYEQGIEAPLILEDLPVGDQPLEFKLGITRVANGLQFTATARQKGDPQEVLFHRTFIDTPASDSVAPLPGLDDDPGPPYEGPFDLVYLPLIEWQVAASEPLEVVYDNFEYSHIPILGDQERAVCLSWPLIEGEFVVESAPTIDGPWVEVTPGATSVEGDRQQVWVLADEQARFFRLREIETP